MKLLHAHMTRYSLPFMRVWMSSAYGVRGGQARGVNPRQVYAVWGAPHGLSHVGLSRVGLRNKRLGFVVRLSKAKRHLRLGG